LLHALGQGIDAAAKGAQLVDDVGGVHPGTIGSARKAVKQVPCGRQVSRRPPPAPSCG
jgi:hypothetical protein